MLTIKHFNLGVLTNFTRDLWSVRDLFLTGQCGLREFCKVRKLRREAKGTQLNIKEVQEVAAAIRKFQACNLLVFGVGNDSRFWAQSNNQGVTVFLEDNLSWKNTMLEKYPEINVFEINYSAKISEAESLIDKPSRLEVKIPEEVKRSGWDVILVDGPCGALEYSLETYGLEPPGRMQSIYMASKLIKKNGYIFVDDCDRPVEERYTEKYLKRDGNKKIISYRGEKNKFVRFQNSNNRKKI